MSGGPCFGSKRSQKKSHCTTTRSTRLVAFELEARRVSVSEPHFPVAPVHPERLRMMRTNPRSRPSRAESSRKNVRGPEGKPCVNSAPLTHHSLHFYDKTGFHPAQNPLLDPAQLTWTFIVPWRNEHIPDTLHRGVNTRQFPRGIGTFCTLFVRQFCSLCTHYTAFRMAGCT